MRALRHELLRKQSNAAENIFGKLYDVDIRRLLTMDDMWERRTRPTPLTLEQARAANETPAQTESLRDRQTLSLADTAHHFLSSASALAHRAANAGPLAFDKDDADALAFVTAASNLRAHVYHIPRQTEFATKQIAGNIIPAIATTNAVVAGLAVVQALHMLAERWDAMRVMSVARRSTRVFTTFPPAPPNAACGVCSDMYLPTAVQVQATKLRDLLAIVHRPMEQGGLAYAEDAEILIAHGTRILYDLDLEDNLDKTLADLHVDVGAALAVVDEAAEKVTVQLLLEGSTDATPTIRWPHGTPTAVPARRPLPRAPSASESDVEAVDAPTQPATCRTPMRRKRHASDDEGDPATTKRAARAAADASAPAPEPTSAPTPAGASEAAAIVLE